MSSVNASTQNGFSAQIGTATGAGGSYIAVPTTNRFVLMVTAVAYSVSAAQSGQTFLLPSVGATVTLPPVGLADGCTFTFRLIANNATTAWTITSGAANIWGNLVQGATATTPLVFAVGDTNVVLGTGGLKGDSCTFTSDGTRYYVSGYSQYNTAAANGWSVS